MKKKCVKANFEFYYEIQEKGIIIARKMTNANKKPVGSDNSLYFGLLDIRQRFENPVTAYFLGREKNVGQFGEKLFNCSCLKDELVKITINANEPNGQFQLKVSLVDKEDGDKIKTNGSMHKIIKASEKKGQFTIDDDLIFIADFINWKVEIMEKSKFEKKYKIS